MLQQKFNIPEGLFNSVKSVLDESTEYQNKVKAHMAKKGIKSLSDLSPEEKKKFFSDLDAMHTSKNEAVTDYNPKSQGGTRKELLAKFAETGNSKDAEAARKAGASQGELKKAAATNAMKRDKNEEIDRIDEIKVGDKVSFNHALSSAPGSSSKKTGTVHQIDGDTVHVKVKDKYGAITHKKKTNELTKEEVEIDEAKSGTGYQLYHKDFSSAMAHAYDFAKQKYGMEIDPLEIDKHVAMGPKKPSSGKSNAYRLLDKTGKKAIQVQVANLDNKRYELNMYKEEIELEETPKVDQGLSGKQKVAARAARGDNSPGFKIGNTTGGTWRGKDSPSPYKDSNVAKSGERKGLITKSAIQKTKDQIKSRLNKEDVNIEEVEQTDEARVKGKGYDNPENERKAPEGKVPFTSFQQGKQGDQAARLHATSVKGKLVRGKAGSAPQKEPQKESYELTPEDIEFINSLNGKQ